jgi:DNA repair exonuclease SbcCD ATPase subunit
MKLSEIRVDQYGPLPRFSHSCTEDFQIVHGPNESGKTLVLEAMLKLLSPGIGAEMPAVSRVEDPPTGHVLLETSNGTEKLGIDTTLDDVSTISPRQLRNVFVVRDSDLELDDEHGFYDTVTQQIGDLHTTEIEAIQSELVEYGRLTSVDGRGLSSAAGNDDAKQVRNRARELHDDVQRYVEEAEDTDIAAAERELVHVKAALQRCRDAIGVQEAAETWDEYDTLSGRLSTYRKATAKLDDDVSSEMLERLEQLARDIENASTDMEEFESTRRDHLEETSKLSTELDTVNAELQSLETREADIEAVEDAVASFRESHSGSIGVSRGMQFAKYVALVGLAAGGGAAVLGSPVVGILIASIGVIAAGWYGLQHRSLTNTERARDHVLETARDAGLDIDSVADIAPAIRSFRDDLERLRDRRDTLEQQIEVQENLLSNCTADLESAREEHGEKRETKQRLLRSLSVPDIDTYRERVESQEALERERMEAASSLKDSLGVASGSDPDEETKISYWDEELEAMVSGVEESVTADEFDAAELESLREEHSDLETRRTELTERLASHEERLREFADRLQELRTEPFLGESITLESRNVDGLREARTRLSGLVDRIEREADIAREALDIFDDVKHEEEQKITDLFGDGSRATDVFQSITDDRYTNVTYDTAARMLQVHRDGQGTLTPDELSHGTTEQLYLAARIGLAEQLLGSEPGFFLMDDAFLPADGDRLREGFDVLETLADAGWQIIYFTAKDEVGKEIVDERGLQCRTLERLP